jgi:exodeoxyribonuclease VII small subunit
MPETSPATAATAGATTGTTAAVPPAPLPPTFDAALSELEHIVTALEQGNVPLEQLLTQYERGTLLQKHCQKILHEAELRIETLNTTDTATGNE